MNVERHFHGQDDDRYHVLEAGIGPGRIVCFPAVGDSASSYHRVLPALVEALDGRVRATAVDPPGYGRSVQKSGHIPDFARLMDWAGQMCADEAGPLLFVGNSSGGAMATAAALAAGERTAGLVLVCWPDWRVGRLPIDTLLPTDIAALEALLASAWHQPPEVPEGMAAMLLQRYASDAFRAHVRSLEPDLVLARYDAYTGPLDFIGGASDDLVPVEILRASVDRRPQARLRVLEACGHFPHRERPEAWVEAVATVAAPHLG